MASTTSKNGPLLSLGLLATVLVSAGCSAIPSSRTVDAENAAVAADPAAGTAAVRAASALPPDDDSGDRLVDSREYDDLWDRIRAGYALPVLDSPLVARHENWFANNPQYIDSMVARARLYLYYIVEEVEKRGMPMEIALLPAIESAYKPHAYSRARAVGLWQFIPSTGRIYGLENNWWYDGRRDVIASTQAALDYLEKLYAQFNDWQLALAAYNCGENRVERLIRENQRLGLPTDYLSLTRLPRETRHYVPKLMAVANIIADPAKYGIELAGIPNTEYFARIEADGQIDLGVIARLTDMPADELFMINPGYQRWITDPNGPHALLIPADKKDAVLDTLARLGETERVQWARHEVRRGDTISDVARRYGVTVEAIRTANKLNGNLLAVGQNLLIPVSANKLAAVEPPTYVRTKAATRSASTAPGGSVKIVHRVRPGETLWSIARRYRVYVHQLRDWNLLEDGDVLRAGQRLFVWTTRGASATAGGGRPG